MMDGYTRRLEWTVDGRLNHLHYDLLGARLEIDHQEIFDLPIDEAKALAVALTHALGLGKLTKVVEGQENAGDPWSADLDAECLRLWGTEKSVAEVAKRLRRSRGSIRARLLRLGVQP